MKTAVILLCSLLWSALAQADALCKAQTVLSNVHPPVLAELYTSEGCSSCPPADRWLSGLAPAGLNRNVVLPLAFHVDYWDYIGWQDRFAQAAFTQRQHERAKQSAAAFVYTPQLLLNGADRRDVYGGYAAVRAAQSSAPAASASIRLQLLPTAQGISAVVDASQAGRSVLYLAVYEDGLSSQVKAGENNGVLLHHDAVVRQLAGPFAPDASGRVQRSVALHYAQGQQVQRSGVAVWLEEPEHGRVVQALSADCAPATPAL